jgi:hypothetical protein
VHSSLLLLEVDACSMLLVFCLAREKAQIAPANVGKGHVALKYCIQYQQFIADEAKRVDIIAKQCRVTCVSHTTKQEHIRQLCE